MLQKLHKICFFGPLCFFCPKYIPFNNCLFSNTFGTLEQFVGRAAKFGIGLILSWILTIRYFIIFILLLLLFNIFCSCFSINGKISDKNVTKFAGNRKVVTKLVTKMFIYPPLMTVLIYVKLRPFKDPKLLLQKVKVNMYRAFGCYLMSLMSLSVFVLKKFQCFSICQFFIFFCQILTFSQQIQVKLSFL